MKNLPFELLRVPVIIILMLRYPDSAVWTSYEKQLYFLDLEWHIAQINVKDIMMTESL